VPATRSYLLRLHGVAAPSNVSLAGAILAFAPLGGPGTWRYDGSSLSVVVETPPVATNTLLSVEVAFSAASVVTEKLMADGSLLGKLRRARLAKQTLDRYNRTPGTHFASSAHLAAMGNGSWLFVVLQV
jgi:hypothetical protein